MCGGPGRYPNEESIAKPENTVLCHEDDVEGEL